MKDFLMLYRVFHASVLALVFFGCFSVRADSQLPAFDFESQSNRGAWVTYDWPELESDVAKTAWRDGMLSIDCRQAKTQYGVASWLKNNMPARSFLRCRVQVKTRGDVFAAIGVAGHRDRLVSGKSRQQFVSSPEYRTANWKTIEWKAPLETGSFMALVLYAGGQGQVWFRGLEVEVVLAGSLPVTDMPWEAQPQDVVANEGLYGKKVFHAIEGVGLPIIFRYRGEASALKDPALLIDVPAGLRVVGSRCNHFGVFSPERVEALPSGDPGRQIYRVNQLAAMKMLKTGWGWRRSSSVFLLADQPFDQPVTLRYAESNAGGQAAWKSFEVVVLPPLQPLPGEPVVSLIPWHQKDIGLPGDASLLEGLLVAYEQAGMTMAQIVRGDEPRRKSRSFEQQLVRRGWTGFMPVSDAMHGWYREAGQLKMEKMTSLTGKKLDALCPMYVLETPEVQKAYCQSLEKQIQAFELASSGKRKPWIALDLELWGEKDVKHACFDSRCMRAFAKRLGLAGTLTAKEIVQKYLPQWRAFRQDQTDQVSKITADYVHRHHPNILVAYYDYSIPLTASEEAKFLDRYPADTRKYDDDLDVHLLSLYRPIDAAFFDLLVHAIDQLSKPVVPVTFINNGSPAYSRHAPQQVYMETMAAGLLGSPGLSIWTGEGVDGAYLSAFNQAQIDLAPWQTFLEQGQRLSPPQGVGPQSESIRCVLREHEGDLLLAVFNYSVDPVPSVAVQSSDLSGHEGVVGRMVKLHDLAPRSVRMISLKNIDRP